MKQFSHEYFRVFFKILILFVLSSNICYSQYEVYSSRDSITKTIYRIQSENLKITYKYVFPEAELQDSVLTRGYEIKFNNKKSSKSHEFIWSKTLMNPIKIDLDSTYLYLRHYVENVKKFK